MDYEAVKKKIDDEFKKEFYKVDYLSKFKIKEKNSGISAIIPTYNRCPYNKSSKKYIYNPLYICVKALLLQKLPLKDIIIIDDCSNDNTKQVVEDLKKEAYNKKGIDLVYIKNEERRGSSISRNSGAKQAKGKYLFFLDDDCVPAPYLSFIALTVIRYLQKKRQKICSSCPSGI